MENPSFCAESSEPLLFLQRRALSYLPGSGSAAWASISSSMAPIWTTSRITGRVSRPPRHSVFATRWSKPQMTKDDIRRYSRELGLSTWDKPSSPCLSSRFPYGTRNHSRKIAESRRLRSFPKRTSDFANFACAITMISRASKSPPASSTGCWKKIRGRPWCADSNRWVSIMSALICRAFAG